MMFRIKILDRNELFSRNPEKKRYLVSFSLNGSIGFTNKSDAFSFCSVFSAFASELITMVRIVNNTANLYAINLKNSCPCINSDFNTYHQNILSISIAENYLFSHTNTLISPDILHHRLTNLLYFSIENLEILHKNKCLPNADILHLLEDVSNRYTEVLRTLEDYRKVEKIHLITK